MLPREKLLNFGINSLTNFELTKLIIGSGNKYENVDTIAIDVLEAIESVDKQITLESLIAIDGIGTAKAAKLLATMELAKRIQTLSFSRRITNPSKLLDFVGYLSSKVQEHLVIVTVDGAKTHINTHEVFKGTLSSTIIHPREIMKIIINDNASGFFMVHNHPSGMLEPSIEDIDATNRILESSKILGVHLIDHVIVSKFGYYSMRDNEDF